MPPYFSFVTNADVDYGLDFRNRPITLPAGTAASLGADYSGAWHNSWTFVITVVDPTGASLAWDPDGTARMADGRRRRANMAA